MRTSRIRLIAYIGMMLALVVTCAEAATRTWDGSDSGTWSDPDNWVENVAPVNGDDLVFTNSLPTIYQPVNNDIVNLAPNSLLFTDGTNTIPLVLAGNDLALTATNFSPLTGVAYARATGGTVATGTYTGHGLLAYQLITVSGAGAPFDGTYTIVSATVTTFTFNVANSGATTSAGNVARAATIEVLNSANGRTVTISNNLALTGAQNWSTRFSSPSYAVLNLMGNLSGGGTVTVCSAASNGSLKPMIRLGGANSAYFGKILAGITLDAGVVLLSPAAQTSGWIDLDNANRNLWLTANASTNPYTFGTGNTSGVPMNVNFRNAGTSGLFLTGGGEVFWDPGMGGSYNWLPGSQSFIRLNGSDTASGQMLRFGNTTGNLVLSGDRALADGTGGNNPALVTMLYALADDAGGQRTLTASPRLLILTRPAVNDANPGKLVLSGGSTAVSNMNQVFDGNLSLGGGILVLDGVSWSAFMANRSAGYGTANSQWQLPSSSGGFAARNGAVSIDTNGVTTNTFNRDFSLGSSVKGTNGQLYADSSVIITQGIVLSANHYVTIRGANTENNAGAWTVTGPVHEISGPIMESGGSRLFEVRGYGTTAGGILRISNTGNSFSGGLRLNSGGVGAGGLVTIFPDDACLGVSTGVYAGSGASGQAALLLFENQGAGVKDFNRNIEISMGGDSSSGDSGFGSWAGQVRYNGTNKVTGSRTTLPVHVQAGRFEFGPTGQIENRSTGGAQTYHKGGAGALVLSNAAVYAGSNTNLYWALHEGTLETWNGSLVTNGTAVFDVKALLLGAAGANIQAAGSFERAWAIRGTDHAYTLSGGHYGTRFTLDVAEGVTLAFNMGSAELVSAEIYGSGAGTQAGVANGTIKAGKGTWSYRSGKTAAGSFGNFAMAVRVQQGIFDVTGPMGRGGLWLDGGTILAGTNSPFTVAATYNRLRVDPSGGKIGISTAAVSDVARSAPFDGTDSTWNLGGTGTVTLASRDNLNLVFSAAAFPDINAGETIWIARDGSGTGQVQLNDTAWTVAGRIGGTGKLKLGSGGTGALALSGGLKVELASDSQGPLTVDGAVSLSGAAVDVTNAPAYAPPGGNTWVILEADSISGTLGLVTDGYKVTTTATQLILSKRVGRGTLMLVR